MEAADYAIKNGYNRFQFIGPIHNPVKGNVDGITLYEKYARFNKDKDLSYARLNIDLLNRTHQNRAHFGSYAAHLFNQGLINVNR